jgi:hypothetical protein
VSETWRYSEETARANDIRDAMDLADQAISYLERRDQVITTQALGMPPRETRLPPVVAKDVRVHPCPGRRGWLFKGAPGEIGRRQGSCPNCGYRFTGRCSCPACSRDSGESCWSNTRVIAERQPGYESKRRVMQGQLDTGECTWTRPVRYAYRIGEYAGERPGWPFSVLGYERDGQPIPEPAPPPPPPPDPMDEYRAVMAEPLTLTCEQLDKLAPYAPREPVTAAEPARPRRDHAAWPALIILAGACLILAAHLGLWFLLPAGVLFALGLWRVRP